ncbi:MAG: thiamine-phosphate synthase family protein, partial [Desulfurococcaceae archaeon]
IALIRNGLDVRAAVNIKYNPVIVNKAVENGLNVVFVDRTLEPEDLKKAEMGTMEWIASQIPPGSKEPDLIYDKGDVGKEAMIRIIGKNAVDAVNKLLRLLT